jgi:5-methyltetrahydrofolate--homocysteine methyltransferase
LFKKFLLCDSKPRKQRSLNIALSDFIAPKTGKTDYMGAFCVTTGFGVDEWAAEFEKDLDDYNSIMHWQTVLQKLLPNIYT